MYPCLTQVRRNVDALIRRQFAEIPGIRIGVIAHGDYCDGPRMISKHDLSTDMRSLCRFVERVESTGGGDAPEAYEAVLHEARGFNWTSGESKALVMIGDEVPHEASEAQNRHRLDWQNEARALNDLAIRIYGVQCLNRRHATRFYQTIARLSGGFHLQLDQFANVNEMLLAVSFQQAGPSALEGYEREIQTSGRMNRNLDDIFARLRGRAVSASMGAADLRAVPPGRFQVLAVDTDMPIKTFCESQGVTFGRGRGFYELTKPELVQGTKEVVLMDRRTGDLYTGSRAREMLDLPLHDEDVRLRPVHLTEYHVFIQSTSNNRKLVGGTRILYEVPDWDVSAS